MDSKYVRPSGLRSYPITERLFQRLYNTLIGLLPWGALSHTMTTQLFWYTKFLLRIMPRQQFGRSILLCPCLCNRASVHSPYFITVLLTAFFYNSSIRESDGLYNWTFFHSTMINSQQTVNAGSMFHAQNACISLPFNSVGLNFDNIQYLLIPSRIHSPSLHLVLVL